MDSSVPASLQTPIAQNYKKSEKITPQYLHRIKSRGQYYKSLSINSIFL